MVKSVSKTFIKTTFLIISIGYSSISILGTTLVERDFSAASVAIGLGSISLPSGSNFAHLNPAQLLHSKYAEANLGYEIGSFNTSLAKMQGFYRFGDFPVLFEFIGSSPKSLEVRNPEGNILEELTFFKGIFSLKSAYGFNFLNLNWKVGAATKIIYDRLADVDSLGVAFDFGIQVPFGIKMFDFLKVKDIHNFSLGVSATNLGPAVEVLGSSTVLPSMVATSLNWLLLQDRINKLNVQLSLGYLTNFASLSSSILPSFSTEYVLFRMLFFRFNLAMKRALFDFGYGFGFRYFIDGKYGLEIDFSEEPLRTFEASRKFNVSFKYFIGNKLNLIKKKIEFKKKQAQDIARDIVQIVNEALADYKLENGNYPARLDMLVATLRKKYKLNKIPRPDKGYLAYDSLLGKVRIKTTDLDEEFNFVLILKNGSKIFCNILKENINTLVIEHKFGKMRIQKHKILKRVSKVLAELDEKIVQAVQGYVNQFKTHRNHYPSSLIELEEYLKVFSAVSLPRPSTGNLFYDAEKGEVSLR